MSSETVYAFSILPPWHRTWWAYLLYSLVALGIIGLIVQWRSKHLRQEKEHLENIVEERTRQLAGQAQKLAEQAEQLKEVDKQKARFFANISHEFRTPLTLIKGPIEQALQTPDESLSKEDEIMIRNNTDRLLRLVNQLLDLSKLDANSMELYPVIGDIFGFLRAVGSAFSSHADQRNIDYHILVPENELYTMFDHDKLEKILYNLLSNAFKFTYDKGEIRVSAFFSERSRSESAKDELLTIEVADTGIGISSEHLPFIFDRFYQTDDSLAREHEGAGIGLSLTKELVVLMGGDIQVTSQPNKGSIFTIQLPVNVTTLDFSPMPHSRSFSEVGEIPSGQEVLKVDLAGVEEVSDGLPIILIVEDNADMRNFIRKQLESNYRILEASQGNEGLEIAKREIPDMIITDLMMPKMDGMVLCGKLKNDEHTSHIPIIMLTAKAGQQHKIEGLETGADDYLTKPFDQKELQVRVNNLIQQRQQLRKKFSREITLQPRNISITSMDEQFLRKVENIIERNFADYQFGLPQFQTALAMSKIQLHRKIKALTDQAPGEFLRNYRLNRAAQILAKQGDNVTQVAYSVGFNNLSYFAKCFKELYGISPSEYSRQTLL
jgi:signal transduction histidine kinase/DNA-binding response OmpR family regulator